MRLFDRKLYISALTYREVRVMKSFEIGMRVSLSPHFGEGKIEGRISKVLNTFEIPSDCWKICFDETNKAKLFPTYRGYYANDGCLVVNEKQLFPIKCRLNRRAR